MTCNCCQGETKKFGQFKNRNGLVQRFRCLRCGKTFSETQPLDGVRIETSKSVQVVKMLCEGVGIRAVSRLTGLSIHTVLNVLETAGAKCASLLDSKMRGLNVEFLQVDELFGYVECKQANTTAEDEFRGDQYTYLSIDRNTKLIVNWLVGKRTSENAHAFMQDLKLRIENRFQLSTDGFSGYTGHLGAVFQTFKREIDYGTEIKHFAADSVSATKRGNRRENPVKLQWCKRNAMIGTPDREFINTSHVERLNLTMRLFNRRLTRCTMGFSKKLANHKHMAALLIAFYNFCRVHSAHKKTPAMAAGITNRIWNVEELISATI